MKKSQSDQYHPKYRPDIDGLRAFAVLSVVVFHAFPSYLRGGFIGVDIFFVISGYLISTIIFTNIYAGKFGFIEFYERRIKRIFPGLLLILIASYTFGWFVLLAVEYKQLGKHMLAGAGFASNFALWGEAGYFDNSGEAKPLLHLWSLGIEEQFYLVWPLLVWLAWKCRINILFITVFIFSISFTLNMTGIKLDAVATFYSPQTRLWELLSGTLLAWLNIHKVTVFDRVNRKFGRWVEPTGVKSGFIVGGEVFRNIISVVGLILLLYGVWRINSNLPFPGKWALIPVLGAVLLISVGPNALVNKRILSNKGLIWFGLISFPLYLWHWPLLSFARILEGSTPDRSIRIGAVLLSIFFAWLTFKFVERPIRLGGHGKLKTSLLFLTMIVVGYVGYNTYDSDGFIFRDVNKAAVSMESGLDGGDGGVMIDECGIGDELVRKRFRKCISDKRGDVRFALMGDSKAESLYAGLVRTSDEMGRWLFIGGAALESVVPLLSSNTDPKRPLTVYATDAIANNKSIKVVVIVASVRGLFNISDGVVGGNLATYNYKYMEKLNSSVLIRRIHDELGRVVGSFVSKGKRVVLVVDNPALPNPVDCVSRTAGSEFRMLFWKNSNSACTISLSMFREQTAEYKKVLVEVQREFHGMVDIFDPTEIYCDTKEDTCSYAKNGRLMYSYTDHISDYSAGLVGHQLNEFVQERLAGNGK